MKPRNKKNCIKCGKDISLSNFYKHHKKCKGIKSVYIKKDWEKENGKYQCPYCSKEFSKMGISSHIWRNHENGKNFIPNNKKYEGEKIIWNKGLTKKTDERVKQIGETYSNKCREGLIIPYWKNKKHNAETKLKMSLNSNDKIIFSSKREREIVNYFKYKYPGIWTTGFVKKFKSEILNCDMYSEKLKICFEYDGIWHFKDIKGQLERKKNKDKLLEEWCIKNEYRLIRIDEEEKLSFEEIEKLFNKPDLIIKIGKRY
jgi:hypothetical protein